MNSDGKEVQVGATALENSPETTSKFLIGTERGTIIVANKKLKKPVETSYRLGWEQRHLGPIYAIVRNMQFPKVFMSIGDCLAPDSAIGYHLCHCSGPVTKR